MVWPCLCRSKRSRRNSMKCWVFCRSKTSCERRALAARCNHRSAVRAAAVARAHRAESRRRSIAASPSARSLPGAADCARQAGCSDASHPASAARLSHARHTAPLVLNVLLDNPFLPTARAVAELGLEEVTRTHRGKARMHGPRALPTPTLSTAVFMLS